MGMFIIDSFRFIDPIDNRDLGDKGLKEQIGGGGCYFVIGARMWLRPDQLQMIVDRGCDWDSQHQQSLESYNEATSPPCRSMWHFRKRADGTTRALNLYKGDLRGFEYLSPKIRLDPKDLLQCSPSTPARLPNWIHLICSPERALAAFADMESICSQVGQAFPKIVYEPIPDSCVFESLADCRKTLRLVTVFSPNHEEAASLLGKPAHQSEKLKTASEAEVTRYLRQLASEFAMFGVMPDPGADTPDVRDGFGPIVCIRCGAWGSVVGRGGLGFANVPAYHGTGTDRACQSPDKIVDVTGAGNAFLGGFTASLIRAGTAIVEISLSQLESAAQYGAVSASLVIEQLGLPDYRVQDELELWNSQEIADRLANMSNRSTLNKSRSAIRS